MTKKAFVQIAKERGITDIRYSGKRRTFFVRGTAEVTSAFLYFVSNVIQSPGFSVTVNFN